MEVIEISPSSSEKKKESEVIEISSSSSEKKKEPEEEDSPLRPVFCLKKKAQMKDFEELEDCFILDLDESPQPKQSDHEHDDVSIVAEKGQVACRDYPHPRHLCVKFPFHTTSHRSYCEWCHCFVCDSAAPCELWTEL